MTAGKMLLGTHHRRTKTVMGGSQVDHVLRVGQRRIRCLVGCWNAELGSRQVLLLTLDTQSKTRHAATDGQHGTDDEPHLEETRMQSLSRGGIKILEPEGWNDASEEAGPGLPNYSGMGANPRDDAEFPDRAKVPNLEEKYGISARI